MKFGYQKINLWNSQVLGFLEIRIHVVPPAVSSTFKNLLMDSSSNMSQSLVPELEISLDSDAELKYESDDLRGRTERGEKEASRRRTASWEGEGE